MSGNRQEQLQAMLAPSVIALGYELWGLEFVRHGRRSVLRLFIDSPEGITVDDCAVVSRQVSAVLDVEDPIAEEYTLEVSSPGMDRPLFTLAQCARYQGEDVSVRLRAPQGGRRNFRGELAAVTETGVVVKVDGVEYPLSMDAIDKMRLLPRFDARDDGPDDAELE